MDNYYTINVDYNSIVYCTEVEFTPLPSRKLSNRARRVRLGDIEKPRTIVEEFLYQRQKFRKRSIAWVNDVGFVTLIKPDKKLIHAMTYRGELNLWQRWHVIIAHAEVRSVWVNSRDVLNHDIQL